MSRSAAVVSRFPWSEASSRFPRTQAVSRSPRRERLRTGADTFTWAACRPKLRRFGIGSAVVLCLWTIGCGPAAADPPPEVSASAVQATSPAATAPAPPPLPPPAPTVDGQAIALVRELVAELDAGRIPAAEAKLAAVRSLLPTMPPAVRHYVAGVERELQRARVAATDPNLPAKLAAVEAALATGDLPNARQLLEAAVAGKTEPLPPELVALRTRVRQAERERLRLSKELEAWGTAAHRPSPAAEATFWLAPAATLQAAATLAPPADPAAVLRRRELLLRLATAAPLPAAWLEAEVGTVPSMLPIEPATASTAATGRALLATALAPETPPDRARRCWDALALLPRPPAEVAVRVLPLPSGLDDASLAARLKAAAKACSVHRLRDPVGLRSWPGLTPEHERLLSELPGRLRELTAEPAGPQTRQAARLWQTVLGLAEPVPVRDATVLAAAESPADHPPAALLDGKWETRKAEESWRSVAKGACWAVLDLGRPRVVTQVKLWNYNGPEGLHVGCRDVLIGVGRVPGGTDAAVLAELPKAPGAATSEDYGVVIDIPPTEGRYVYFECRTTHGNDVRGGLTEVVVKAAFE